MIAEQSMTRTHCMSGLHVLTPLNTLIQVVKGRTTRRCAECRYVSSKARYARAAHPLRRTTCRSGKHPWIPENWHACRGKARTWRCCRRCRDEREANRYTRIDCLGQNCTRSTRRRDGSGTYLCRRHRQAPPAWIKAAGLRVIGTQVRAA